MRRIILSNPIVSRYLPAGLFIGVGLSITAFFLLLGGASWVVPCFFSLVPVGILWIRRPTLAAVLSIGPLLGIASLLRYMPIAHLGGAPYPLFAAYVATFILVPLAALLAAAFFLVTALRDWHRWRLPFVLSFGFVAASFITDRLFINVRTVRTYKVQFSLDGKGPWAADLPWRKGYIAIYRSVGNGYCFDEIESQELHDRLASKGGDTVLVEYEITSDFGHVRGYNVLRVDGVYVKDQNRAGGSGANGSGSSPECF